MIKNAQVVPLLLSALILVACSRSSQPNTAEFSKPTPEAATAPQPTTESSSLRPATNRGVKTEMRNVLFHFTNQASAHLETLSGELWPTGKNEMPVFDDKSSFEVRVSNGRVSITPESLASIMNNHVFAKSDAPLKDLSISIDGNKMIIKGKLHTKGDISFETTGTVSTSPDGRIRVHTEKVKALHVSLTGVMGAFGIDLASVINTSKIEGMDTDKNDLLMDLGALLPPPHIRGKVTGVMLEKNAIVTLFGDGGKSTPPAVEQGNYMSFQGNPVRFGKLVMESADLTILDLDPNDPLDWNQEHYRDQLVAGYAKITPAFGLRAYVKDFAKLSRSSASQSPH
jgi:hypothetical protein